MAKTVLSSLGTPAGALLSGSVFAAIGWLVTYTVENVVSVPTVSYSTEISATPDKEFRAEIQNLSRDHKFSGLQFLMRLPADGLGRFVAAEIVPFAPAYSARDPINTQDTSVTFATVTLHPGTSMTLVGEFTGDSEPTLHIGAASTQVRLLETGPLTWVIDNELCILSVLSGIWLLIVLIVLFTKFGEGKNATLEPNVQSLSIQGSLSIDNAVAEARGQTFSIQGNVSISDTQRGAGAGAGGGGSAGDNPDAG